MSRNLRVRTGCLRCRERKKKCDETKPKCNKCTQLHLECRWPWTANHHANLANIGFECSTEATDVMQIAIPGYDDPSVLQASATSLMRNQEDKQAFLYLCEKGSAILRYPTPLLPARSTVNPFRLGFQMASHYPVQVQAYLALGAAHMCRSLDLSESLALRYYAKVVSALRAELEDDVACPQEPACAVAAILCVYELVAFSSVERRLVHLNGYYKLVEARLANNASWGPFQVLVDHYIHSFSINTLSHFAYHVGDKSINFTHDLIQRFKHGQPGMGKEIVGVPANLTIAIYKLTFLLHQDITQSPWNTEVEIVSRLVGGWYPASYALTPNATGLLVVGKLYQLACTCLLLYVKDRTINIRDARVTRAVEESVQIVESSMLRDYPFNCLSWALLILGLFTVTNDDRKILREPLCSLVEIGKMGGYQTVVDLLNSAWEQGLGPSVLDDEALLAGLSI